MAKKPASSKKSSAKGYTTADVTRLEQESMKRANKAISSIENAIAVWDAAKVERPDLAMRINRLKFFHDELSRWEKRMLMGMAKKQDIESRISRLREFSDICYRYSQG